MRRSTIKNGSLRLVVLAALGLICAGLWSGSALGRRPAARAVRRAVRPRPARRPSRLRPARRATSTVVRRRLPAARPVIYTGSAGPSVVVVESDDADSAEPVAQEVTRAGDDYVGHQSSDGSAASTDATAPIDADESLADCVAYEVLSIGDDGLSAVLDIDGERATVRMIGVAPIETQRPQRPQSSDAGSSRRPASKGGGMTRLFLENLLKGESVYVVYDSMVAEQDEDGKFVAYLYRSPDGLLVNMELVRQGFAGADASYDFEEADSFAYYQRNARKLGKGLYRRANRKEARDRPSLSKPPGAPGRAVR